MAEIDTKSKYLLNVLLRLELRYALNKHISLHILTMRIMVGPKCTMNDANFKKNPKMRFCFLQKFSGKNA